MKAEIYFKYNGSYIDDDDYELVYPLQSMIREKYGFKKVLDNSSFDNDYCIEIGCSDSEQMKKVIDIVAGNTYKDILDYMGNHSLSFDKVILEMKE